MKIRKLLSACLALVLCLSLVAPALAISQADALKDTASYLQKTVPDPQVGSIGGEWMVLGLARGGYTVPSGYYNNVVSYVKSCGGVLHNRKYTEYSRVILALTAMGKDPTNVGGYNLVEPLNDYDKTIWQGINGPIFALIALDSGNYANSQRQAYIDYILSCEISGGGWALTGSTADVDITAMALQALAKYQDRPDVTEAVEKALELLSKKQDTTGGFPVADGETSESLAQVIVALTELGIPLTDARFVKDGHTVLDRLLEFQMESGGFRHIPEGEEDLMATEQSFYALVAVARAERGDSTLYTMTP